KWGEGPPGWPLAPLAGRGCRGAAGEGTRRSRSSMDRLLQVVAEDLGAHRAGVLRAHNAALVEEIRLRHAADAVRDRGEAAVVDERRIRGPALIQKPENLLLGILEHDADELHVRPHLPRVRNEHRMLFPTRPAPRRPEIEDHRLAAELGDVDRPAGADFLQRERGRGLADQRRTDLRRVLAEPDEEHADERERDQRADDDDRAVHAVSAAMLSLTLAVSTRMVRGGISAITPPRPITMTAIQIQTTSGVT